MKQKKTYNYFNLFNMLRLLRPYQWLKNSFVLAGIVFGHAWHDNLRLKAALLSTLAFCLLSSSLYIYNDIFDAEKDRLHPVKKNRPLASYKISLKTAATISIGLCLLALLIAASVSEYILFFLGLYILLNIAYTHIFKYIPVLDVFAICTGFMLRILTGTVGLHIPPSPWLLFCGLNLTLFLGFTKRRAESGIAQKNEYLLSRQVLKNYTVIFLDKMISITASCSIISYALYTMNPETILTHHTQNLIYTVPFVSYGIFRYLYLLHQVNSFTGEDTAKDFLTDKHLLFTVLAWLSVFFYFIL